MLGKLHSLKNVGRKVPDRRLVYVTAGLFLDGENLKKI
jgi:hypothetical protein